MTTIHTPTTYDLRTWRLAAGVATAAELARLLGMSDAAPVQRWETGDREVPEDRIDQLIDLLGEPPGTAARPPIVERRWIEYQAEVICMLCGRTVGTIIVSDQPITATPERRCEECGGVGLISEVTSRKRSSMTGLRATPRRGRPPVWLVDERNQLKENPDQ